MNHNQRIVSRARAGTDSAPPALHNSGPVAREVYRTAAVGRIFHLDIRTLLGWSALPRELRRPIRYGVHGPGGHLSPEHLISPDKAHGIASFLLDAPELAGPELATGSGSTTPAIQCDAAGRGHEDANATGPARAAIAALAGRLAGLGWLCPFHGLATSTSTEHGSTARENTDMQNEWPWLPGGKEHSLLRLAWCVCAVSYLSPPLILWSRSPSLAWWRGDEVIALRWFGQINNGVSTTLNAGVRT